MKRPAVIENIQKVAFHCPPIAHPTIPPRKAAREEVKFIDKACLILNPDATNTAKSPKTKTVFLFPRPK